MVLYDWKGKVLAGVGKCLRYYEIGHKRMLRKAEVKNLQSPVNTIKTWGERIYATEVNDSFHMYKYKAREQTFYDIADDVLNRYVTTTAILDYHTMIGADKFENIFISRVPHSNSKIMQMQNKISKIILMLISLDGKMDISMELPSKWNKSAASM